MEGDPTHSLVPSQMETPEGIQEEVRGKGKRLSGAPDRGAPPLAFSVRGGIWGEEWREEKETRETPCLGPKLDLTRLTLSGKGRGWYQDSAPGTRSISGSHPWPHS